VVEDLGQQIHDFAVWPLPFHLRTALVLRQVLGRQWTVDPLGGYVLSLPLVGSNRWTAFMSPMFPSETRSRNGNPSRLVIIRDSLRVTRLARYQLMSGRFIAIFGPRSEFTSSWTLRSWVWDAWRFQCSVGNQVIDRNRRIVGGNDLLRNGFVGGAYSSWEKSFTIRWLTSRSGIWTRKLLSKLRDKRWS
jgi:hypothetical protein